jgi:hypothetical protein
MGASIEFLCSQQLIDRIPRPYPAREHTPDWLKAMPMDRAGVDGPGPYDGTVKRCPPFLEAMTAGYLIPLPCDVYFAVDASGKFTAKAQHDIISAHGHAQYQGAPFDKMLVLKFRNPWIVRTPPGYSCLFTAPVNRFEIPFTPLTGIVETDTYYDQVNIPTLCHLRPGSSITMAAGTPMFQVVPFQREEWKSQFGARDEERRSALAQQFNENVHAYREHYWQKHSYM